MRTGLLCVCVLALAGACSGDGDTGSRGAVGDGDSGDGDFGNSGGDGDGDFGNGTGTGALPGGTGALAAGDGDGDLELTGSYIWIANSDEGTVSKIDTRTMEELGRYLANPNGDGHPSRTSVGATGAVVVANRGGGIDFLGGTGAGVTKIEATSDLCEDRNGNGVIDTSTGAGDVKDWMEDECISWWTPIDAYSNRPVSWAPPSGPDAPEKVWTSGARNCTAAECYLTVYRLNGDTGVIEDQVEIGPLSGAPFTFADILGNYGAYGGAPDAGGHFWGFVANTTHLFRVDAVTLEVRTWPIPNANGYGITVDPKGRVFVCGLFGLSRFDPATQSWTEVAGGGGTNGCMTDGGDRIWVGGAGLQEYDAESMALIQTHMVGGGVKGVSIDFDNKVWGVGGGMSGNGSEAYRLDPATGQYDTFTGLVGAYSYSDMTGFGLKKAGFVPIDPQ